MKENTIKPPKVMPSIYGPTPRTRRAADLPLMTSLNITDLFPEIKQGFISSQGLDDIRKMTTEVLANVDMSNIKSDDTVNILCSEHGFYILEGLHYREMLKSIGDVVKDKTGCQHIRYRVASGVGIREADEVIEYFDLKEYLNGRVSAMSPFDKGIPIDTEIGTLYGLAKAYDSDWIIHAFHDEPRDLYFHRMMNRLLKPFTMSYARFETRAVYHTSFSNRSGNFLQKAIFDSAFVQQKFAFACILTSTPAGITGVDADNDLYNLDQRITRDLLKDFGRMLRLISEIDECIALWDAGRWGYYLHAGGIVFGCLENAKYDAFDLTVPSAMGLDKILEKYFTGQIDKLDQIMDVNPAIKALVINQAWPGLPVTDVPRHVPTIVVGQDQADLWDQDAANPDFMNHADTAETLETAVDLAIKSAKTDKIIAFDGSFGTITVSEPLAEFLRSKAPEVSKKVDTHYLPLWLKQRGLDSDGDN